MILRFCAMAVAALVLAGCANGDDDDNVGRDSDFWSDRYPEHFEDGEGGIFDDDDDDDD